ncbi:hypothetical protein RhiirC2_745923 [Rhizophagus irregularis]|uniref:Uncharacterized protein n=1 Tax=Rhizophagus irregularis TaxID=588596 RepID=A0A2N1NA25_9GLOM|nr:hypothetical protein RhiirC2_745923 [Rhizophagus irregularis]
MTISTISEWARTKFKSNWTRLFILTSILQLLAVVALESRVLVRNTKFREIVSGIENDCARPSKDRMLLIIQENVIFMIFQLFQLWFCLNAVIKQNTIQIITLTVINFLCALYGIVQIVEIYKWANDLKSACGAVAEIQKEFFRVDFPLVVTLIIFALIMSLISFKLYQQFGWNIYKKIGADIKMQKLYKTMLLFVMLLKLDLFFLLLVSIEVFFAFSEDKGIGKIQFTFTLSRSLYYFHLGVTIMIFFLEVLAYRSLQKEWKNGMIIYIILSTVTIIDFIMILKSATSTVSNSWYFFIVFLSVSIILCTATWVYAILVYRNFDKGLKTVLSKNKKAVNTNNDPEIGSSTQVSGNGGKRFTIED